MIAFKSFINPSKFAISADNSSVDTDLVVRNVTSGGALGEFTGSGERHFDGVACPLDGDWERAVKI